MTAVWSVGSDIGTDLILGPEIPLGSESIKSSAYALPVSARENVITGALEGRLEFVLNSFARCLTFIAVCRLTAVIGSPL